MATFSNQANSVDTQLAAGAATTNYGTDTNITIGEASGVYRSLIKWDLSSIPANATVVSAILSIYAWNDFSSNARTMSAYRVLRNWVETEATWNVFSTGNNWGTAGCSNTTSDREATDIGTAAIGAAVATNTEIAITLTAAKVQEWIAGTTANYGLLLKVDTESNDNYQYYSHEHATSGTRPKLVITYTISFNFLPFI